MRPYMEIIISNISSSWSLKGSQKLLKCIGYQILEPSWPYFTSKEKGFSPVFVPDYFLRNIFLVCLLSHLTLDLSITQTTTTKKKKITDSKSSNGLKQTWEMRLLQLTSINILFHALFKTLDLRSTTPSRKHFKQVELLRSHYECWAEVLEEICNVACCTATTNRTTHLCMSLMAHLIWDWTLCSQYLQTS